MASVSLPDEVRVACAWVAARSRSVRVDEERISAFAEDLRATTWETDDSVAFAAADPETAAAFAICMNAINFGSGWWPTVRKRPGLSGYATMEAGVRERFDADGPWRAEELVAMRASEIAAVVGQDPNTR